MNKTLFFSKLNMTEIKILLVQYDEHSIFNLLSFNLYSNNKKRISEEDKKQKSFLLHKRIDRRM